MTSRGDDTPNAPAEVASQTAPAHPGSTPLGAITVQERAVAKIAAQAVREVPDAGSAARRVLGVSAPFDAANLAAPPKVDVDVDLSVTSVELFISVRWPASVPKVSAAVRANIIERLRTMTGLRVTDVRIHVSDLVTQVDAAPRVR